MPMKPRTPIGRIAEAIQAIVEMAKRGDDTNRQQKALLERIRRHAKRKAA